jgi:hypothetical protein
MLFHILEVRNEARILMTELHQSTYFENSYVTFGSEVVLVDFVRIYVWFQTD